MATDAELTRLADSASGLRPDWSARSVRAYLAAKHRDRSFGDLAVALAVIATDPTVDTPARLEQHGPWWLATRHVAGRSSVPDVGPGRGVEACARPGHEHEAAHNCRACRAEELADTEPAVPGPVVPAPAGLLPRGRDDRAPASHRDFASTYVLPDVAQPTRCGRCTASFVDTDAGRSAHQTVFGHAPLADAEHAAEAAS